MDDLTKRNELRKNEIKKELEKLKKFKSKYKVKLTVARLKAMEGFKKVSDETARQIINQLEEYTKIIIKQLNRLSIKKVKHEK